MTGLRWVDSMNGGPRLFLICALAALICPFYRLIGVEDRTI